MNGYEGLRTGSAWIDLSARGTIRVTGDDRARLLHAMSTNHVQGLGEGAGLYTFFLNEKGRILADAYIYNFGESLLVDTEPETARSLLAHLDRYVIADDVTLQDETGRWTVIGLEGPASEPTAVRLGIAVPRGRDGVLEWGDGFVTRVASTGPTGIRIFLLVEERHNFMARLTAAGIPHATAEEARIVRLENGKPRYGEEINDRYLVAETRQLQAVHFDKGCYLGQEIVERVRSRGQVHRHLTAVEFNGAVAPAPGTKLVSGDTPVAEIASAVYSPALGKSVGLAYARTEALENNLPMTVEGSDPPIAARLAIAQNSSVAV